MTQVVIEDPIINSPFDESTRHFRFTDEGITNEIVDGRRTSSYFVPIANLRNWPHNCDAVPSSAYLASSSATSTVTAPRSSPLCRRFFEAAL